MRPDTEAVAQAARVVTSAGLLLYRDAGDGPPVIFLQGLLTGPQVWDGVGPALSSHYRCITVDWPFGAHPEPMRPDADLSPPGLARLVVEFLGLLGLSNAALVGNYSGGVICQLVIAEHPDMADTAFPGSHFGMVEDSATFISVDQPGCLTTLIHEFLSSAIRPTPKIP